VLTTTHLYRPSCRLCSPPHPLRRHAVCAHTTYMYLSSCRMCSPPRRLLRQTVCAHHHLVSAVMPPVLTTIQSLKYVSTNDKIVKTYTRPKQRFKRNAVQ
jgi:hypothetical protein